MRNNTSHNNNNRLFANSKLDRVGDALICSCAYKIAAHFKVVDCSSELVNKLPFEMFEWVFSGFFLWLFEAKFRKLFFCIYDTFVQSKIDEIFGTKATSNETEYIKSRLAFFPFTIQNDILIGIFFFHIHTQRINFYILNRMWFVRVDGYICIWIVCWFTFTQYTPHMISSERRSCDDVVVTVSKRPVDAPSRHTNVW